MLSNSWKVIGIDAITNYYDINLKKKRLELLKEKFNYVNYKGCIKNQKLLDKIYLKHNPDIIIHLAAQAGVRYSIDNPISYVEENLLGTFHILEIARKYRPKHLLIASTSSVYGNNDMPFNENQKTDNPLSFYAATKKSNEIMAHSYSHLHNLPTTIVRFFTVYGPWGRPDMALFKFTKNILSGLPIDIFNNGNMKRDFTYIDDLVKAIHLLISKIPEQVDDRYKLIKNDNISKWAPFRVVNVGNSKPINLLDYIECLEKVLGKEAKKNYLGIQNGEVKDTFSDVKLLKALTGFLPNTTLYDGIYEFVKWYKSYY